MKSKKKNAVQVVGALGSGLNNMTDREKWCVKNNGVEFESNSCFNSACQNILGTLVNEAGEQVLYKGKRITKAYVLGAIAYGHYKGKAKIVRNAKLGKVGERKSYGICLLENAESIEWSNVSSCGAIRK